MQINLGASLYYLDEKSYKIFSVKLTLIDISLQILHLYRESQGTTYLSFFNKVGKNVFVSKIDEYNKKENEVIFYTSAYIIIDTSLQKKNIDLINSCKTINDVIISRNIRHLYHFTNIRNLESILEYNLLPINELKNRNIVFEYNDPSRLDGFKNRNSFSLSFPNDHFLTRLMLDHPERTYIILEFDVQILNFLVEAPYFCKHNAARSDITPASCTGVTSFSDMFPNEFYFKNPQSMDHHGKMPILRKRSPELPLCYPSDSQAEILIKGEINSVYISRIIFKDEIDQHFKNICIRFGKRCIIDNRYYKHREEVYEDIING